MTAFRKRAALLESLHLPQTRPSALAATFPNRSTRSAVPHTVRSGAQLFVAASHR